MNEERPPGDLTQWLSSQPFEYTGAGAGKTPCERLPAALVSPGKINRICKLKNRQVADSEPPRLPLVKWVTGLCGGKLGVA